MGEINKSKDIINILMEDVKINFNRFGHQSSRFLWWWQTKYWWWNTEDFGGSWSPFVEACFLEVGKKYPNYKVFCCVENSEQLKNYMRNSYPSFQCKKSDIDISDTITNEFVLSLEHSEDSPSMGQIDRYKSQIGYKKSDDQDVKGEPTKKQLIALRQEVWKLKENQLQLNSKFKVVISRPKCFDKINENKTPSYFDSVIYFKKQIEKDLKKDAESFKDYETWLIILIAPKHGSLDAKEDEIIFYCYEWNNKTKCLSDTQITPIPVKKMENYKWVIDNEKKPS